MFKEATEKQINYINFLKKKLSVLENKIISELDKNHKIWSGIGIAEKNNDSAEIINVYDDYILQDSYTLSLAIQVINVEIQATVNEAFKLLSIRDGKNADYKLWIREVNNVLYI